MSRCKLQAVSRSQCRMALLFFAGLLLTAACSAWYHLGPSDAGRAVDRCGMVLAFAGLLGLSAGGHVSARAGTWLAAGVLLLGPLSVAVWSVTGNVMAWLVLQFGGMGLIVWFACLKRHSGALPVHWGLVILVYAVAKWLELADQNIYARTGHGISGHSLKHIVASCAAWPVVAALIHQRKLPAPV